MLQSKKIGASNHHEIARYYLSTHNIICFRTFLDFCSTNNLSVYFLKIMILSSKKYDFIFQKYDFIFQKSMISYWFEVNPGSDLNWYGAGWLRQLNNRQCQYCHSSQHGNASRAYIVKIEKHKCKFFTQSSDYYYDIIFFAVHGTLTKMTPLSVYALCFYILYPERNLVLSSYNNASENSKPW